jgi:hypothetical protein
LSQFFRSIPSFGRHLVLAGGMGVAMARRRFLCAGRKPLAVAPKNLEKLRKMQQLRLSVQKPFQILIDSL